MSSVVKIASSNGRIGSTSTSSVREVLGAWMLVGLPTSSFFNCGRIFRRLYRRSGASRVSGAV